MNSFADCPQIKIFSTLNELVNSQFQGNTNAFCWQRNLLGDFGEIASRLQLKDDITEVSVDDLLALQLSEKGKMARETILNDLK